MTCSEVAEMEAGRVVDQIEAVVAGRAVWAVPRRPVPEAIASARAVVTGRSTWQDSRAIGRNAQSVARR